MSELAWAEIERKRALLKQIAEDHEEVVLKIGEIAREIDKINEANPKDMYHHLDGDLVYILDAMLAMIRYPAKYPDDYTVRRLVSFSSIPQEDFVNAMLVALGRGTYRSKGWRLGGRKSRLVEIKKEIESAWQHFLIPPVIFKDPWWQDEPRHYFDDRCKEIEKEYARSTVMQALKELCDGM